MVLRAEDAVVIFIVDIFITCFREEIANVIITAVVA